MKFSNRMIITVSLLAALIVGFSLYAQSYLHTESKKLEGHIEGIEYSIKTGNWQKAETELTEMKEKWSGTQNIWAILVDHIEIDNIDYTMSRFTEFIKTKQHAFALAEASSLMQYVKHIPQKESFSLQNIF